MCCIFFFFSNGFSMLCFQLFAYTIYNGLSTLVFQWVACFLFFNMGYICFVFNEQDTFCFQYILFIPFVFKCVVFNGLYKHFLMNYLLGFQWVVYSIFLMGCVCFTFLWAMYWLYKNYNREIISLGQMMGVSYPMISNYLDVYW